MSSTVRISPHGRLLLGQLARETGTSMTDVLDTALESFRRQRFLEQANAAYLALAADEPASQAYRRELEEWEQTAGDGLESMTP